MTTSESGANQKSHIPKEDFETKVPAGRPGNDRDMASAILFVACNTYLNGERLLLWMVDTLFVQAGKHSISGQILPKDRA